MFFPRSCTTHAQPYNCVRQLSINAGTVIAEVWEHPYGPDPPSIFYSLTPALAKIQAGVSNRFRVVHDQLHASRAIDHALTAEELAKLAPTR